MQNWIMASTAMYLDMIMSAVSSAMQLVLRVRTIRIQMAEMTTMSLAVPMSVV